MPIASKSLNRDTCKISDIRFLSLASLYLPKCFKGKEGALSGNMAASFIYLVLFALTSIGKVRCDGQFFRMNKDDNPLKMEEPFLTADIFECQREKSCITLIRNSTTKREGVDRKNAILSISKTTGLFTKCFQCSFMKFVVNDIISFHVRYQFACTH